MRVSKINHKGKEIIVVDCSELTVQHKEEITNCFSEGGKLIAACQPGSALIITIVTNIRFNAEVFEAFKNFASNNTIYVKASAIVGLDGLQKIMFNTIKTLTKRDYYIAKSFEDAKEYLASFK